MYSSLKTGGAELWFCKNDNGLGWDRLKNEPD